MLVFMSTSIVPRKGLAFSLDQPIARHWLAGDAFRTRLFDATSTLFPEGERFFIASVAKFRDRITDQALQSDVRAFMIQEAQHGRQHELLNAHLRAQRIDVDRLEEQSRRAFAFLLRRAPERYTLAQTAAAEHVTALLATALFESPELLEGADPRVRALFYWHAVEEIEHRSVAFDVMKNVARTPYLLRASVMLVVVLGFHARVFYAMDQMFRADGFGWFARLLLWMRGLAWMFGGRGPYRPRMSRFFAYFHPQFHPSHAAEPEAKERWTRAYEHGRDPLGAMAELRVGI